MNRPQWLGNLTNSQLLGLCIWSEAGSEPVLGKLAVGNVVMNRVGKSEYGLTVRDVILKPYAFSWFNDLPDNIALTTGLSTSIAELVLFGATVDITKGCTHFHAATMNPYPYWASSMFRVTQIGNHIFYR